MATLFARLRLVAAAFLYVSCGATSPRVHTQTVIHRQVTCAKGLVKYRNSCHRWVNIRRFYKCPAGDKPVVYLEPSEPGGYDMWTVCCGTGPGRCRHFYEYQKEIE